MFLLDNRQWSIVTKKGLQSASAETFKFDKWISKSYDLLPLDDSRDNLLHGKYS